MKMFDALKVMRAEPDALPGFMVHFETVTPGGLASDYFSEVLKGRSR